jgi:hypothetical protein
MRIHITREKWNKLGNPTAGNDWYLIKKQNKVWFSIVEQGWTRDGVYLLLKKKKTRQTKYKEVTNEQ